MVPISAHARIHRSLKVQLYGRAVLYTGAAGQIVKQISATDYFKVGESE